MRRDLDALERQRKADARKAHRSLPKLARAMADLINVLDVLKVYARRTPTQALRDPNHERVLSRLLRQYHRLNRVISTLNAEV
jgi:hypothetical protein